MKISSGLYNFRDVPWLSSEATEGKKLAGVLGKIKHASIHGVRYSSSNIRDIRVVIK
ncbi:hypothetical protein WN55_09931 [Dufourea novaeangliae]|uniref:Uncharacterized protein n=1 Tax=Dufourea novaeangliae TaxID=178035 RepID=A0A154P7I4_DUFNO|nr:hypothetical protein WN55_09931 [Dufourea novaeangliae]